MTGWDDHPAVRTGTDLTLGEKAADAAVAIMGSWRYLGIQTAFIGIWMALNVIAWCSHWDPYPWILLNLIFSIQAAYSAPLILLASRRSDQRDSERAEHDLEVNLEALERIRRIEESHLHRLEALLRGVDE